MTSNSKRGTDQSDSVSKTNKLIHHRIWPVSSVQMQEKWTRDNLLQTTNNSLSNPRCQTLLYAESFIDRRNIYDDQRGSFHFAMGPILAAAMCFGIFPLGGLLSKSPEKLVFKKISWRTIYALVVIIMLFTTAMISIIHTIHSLRANSFFVRGGIEAATVGTVFYGINFVVAVHFTLLAPRWILLQRDWRALERFLNRVKHRPLKLRLKFSMITAVVMIVALVEHTLSIANSFSPSIWSSTSNWTFALVLQDHARNSHGFFFTVCNYNFVIGIFTICVNIIGVFTSNFTDVFIILNSLGLAEGYSTLNQRLIGGLPNYPKNVDWQEIRQCYAKLSALVKNVDKNISPIILLSFTKNLYFICLQLLNGLSLGSNSTLNNVYFFGSFICLVGKAVAVTLLTARVNDHSKLALPVLYECPGQVYNIETQRLLQQLTTDEVCLTGLRFFSITRSFLLAVCGAVLTYEVILLQFNGATKK